MFMTIDDAKYMVKQMSTEYNFNYEDAIEKYIKKDDTIIKQDIRKEESIEVSETKETAEKESTVKTKKTTKKAMKTKEPKENEKEKEKASFILPYVGEIDESVCYGIKFNYGLHTQCKNKRMKSKDYCRTCCKNISKTNGDKPPSGDIRDRSSVGLLDYIDPSGKKTVPYANYMKKMKLTKEQVIEEATRFNIQIPEDHFVEVDRRKSRKTTTKQEQEQEQEQTNQKDAGENQEKKVKKRGRPKKQHIVTTESEEIKVEQDKKQEQEQEQEDTVPDNEIKSTMTEKEVDENNDNVHICDKIKYENNIYLRTRENQIFDIHTEEFIGMYNTETKKIEFQMDEKEEDEEE